MDAALIAVAFLGLLSLVVYGRVSARIAQTGGMVPVKNFALPDVVAGGALGLCLLALCFETPPKVMHDSDLVNSAFLNLMIVAFLCSFLYFRKFNLVEQFGLRAAWLVKAPWLAFLFLLAAYPMLMCANVVMEMYTGPGEKQELIQYFSDAVRNHDRRAVYYMFITATVVAPLTEELVFRGYLYGILKRYMGPRAGLLLTAALFAGVHQTPAVMPGLFLLAVCLTLAYEFTGSILVNMCMHSLFNLISLTVAYHHPLPAVQ